MTTIKINNAKFYGFHGDMEHEREFGNQFEVDVEMLCDLSNLDGTDKLSRTVDYLSVYNELKEVFHHKKFYLIETLNLAICNMILEKFPPVKKVKVSVRKRNAPLGIIDSVEVTNEVSRE